jgi:ketosteroid isomerase-like protein
MIGLLALGCTAALAFAQPTPNDDAAKTIEKMEQQWADAARKLDTKPLEQMLADDYTLTLSVGRVVDKESYVGKIKDGSFKIESIDYGDMKTRVYGDCAVVIGRASVKGSWDGNDIGGDYAFTDTFVKKGSAWKQVASQITRIEG